MSPFDFAVMHFVYWRAEPAVMSRHDLFFASLLDVDWNIFSKIIL